MCLLLVPAMTNAQNDEAIDKQGEVQELSYEYIPFYGVITEVNSNDGLTSILIENFNEEPYDKMVFYISDDVVLVSDKTKDLADKNTLTEGIEVVVYYHKDTPILESYPARAGCNVVVIKKNEEPTNVEVFRFDENLLSSDRILRISPDENTAIVDTKGNSLTVEDIKNRDAIVFYSIATLSIPAQTVPEKVILLNGNKLKSMDKIIINDEEITLNKPMYINENGVIMVPLRQMAEALGYKVIWNEENRSVEVVKGANWFLVKIGKDDYNLAKSIVKLGTAPELIDWTTYVPLDFVELIGANIGFTIDGVLQIN